MKTSFSILILAILAVLLTYSIGCFYAYFYPMAYSQEITSISKKYDVNSALVASIVNSESNFNENAKSGKGAVGLMQLMPSTAQWIAKKIGVEYSDELLSKPEYNLEIGTYYIGYLIDMFGNEEVALCAYNAGPSNVKNWLANKEYSQDGKTLEKIPFKETKNYINKVYKNYHYYKNKYK